MEFNLIYAPLAIALYLGAGLCLALGAVRERRGLRRMGILIACAAILVHAVWLVHSVPVAGRWDANFFNTLSLTAWLVSAVVLLSGLRLRTPEAGIIAFPIAAVCLMAQWLLPAEPLLLAHLTTTMQTHVLTSLLAYSLLSIAAINALLLAAQEYVLRHPRPMAQLERLPPLAVIETIMFRLITAGWVVLTVSLATGIVFIDHLFAQHLVHKTTLSIVSWLLFGALLLGRYRLGWRGQRAIRWTLAAMIILALAYFGSKLVLELILDRSWIAPAAGPLS